MNLGSIVSFWPRRVERNSFGELHTEVGRLFDTFIKDLSNLSEPSSSFLIPKVDVREFDHYFEVSIELAGVEEKDIQVDLSGNTLTIKAEKNLEKKDETKNYHCFERSYGSFMRSFTLPINADLNGISATFKNGVLTFSIPKLQQPNNDIKKISINQPASNQ